MWSHHLLTHSLCSSHVALAAASGLQQTMQPASVGLDTVPAEVLLGTQTKVAQIVLKTGLD